MPGSSMPWQKNFSNQKEKRMKRILSLALVEEDGKVYEKRDIYLPDPKDGTLETNHFLFKIICTDFEVDHQSRLLT